jgi:hypothetical protein
MRYAVAIMVICGYLIGCSLAHDEQPVSGLITQPQTVDNGLNFNSIVFNSRVFSSLSARPLSLGRNSEGQLIFNALEGMESTESGRELLQYVAQCALEPRDVLLVQSGTVQYQFPGLFGIVPEWEYREIDATEKEQISACLLAHVNAYGESVHISVRSPGVISADPDESRSHPVYEGTFFGDLFGPTLKAYACTGSLREIAAQHAPDRLLRSCADATPDCQLDVVGRCRDVCDSYSDKYGWQDCWAEGRPYAETVSVFLRDDNADRANRTCDAGRRCYFSVARGDAIFDCSDAHMCTTGCLNASYCTIEGSGAADIYALAWSRSMSEINCQEAGQCSATCLQGSQCDIDCWRADSCSQNFCAGGAACLLDCTGSADCGFAYCEGGQASCSNDVVVCNRACP